ncbi:hypothetical protein LCGC14_0548410 [marine sediment metagenome]|uniref:Uncharacterized protein n=1 Tax=marine sediment metagenome TaxID=412755 RepID=A0A0F9RQV4_9ZZZZ
MWYPENIIIKMGILTEKEFKKICKIKPSCYCPPIHIAFSGYAETPEYLRRFIAYINHNKKKD